MHEEQSLKNITTFNWVIFWKGFQIYQYFLSKSALQTDADLT